MLVRQLNELLHRQYIDFDRSEPELQKLWSNNKTMDCMRGDDCKLIWNLITSSASERHLESVIVSYDQQSHRKPSSDRQMRSSKQISSV